jgi:hypothetical protein
MPQLYPELEITQILGDFFWDWKNMENQYAVSSLYCTALEIWNFFPRSVSVEVQVSADGQHNSRILKNCALLIF